HEACPLFCVQVFGGEPQRHESEAGPDSERQSQKVQNQEQLVHELSSSLRARAREALADLESAAGSGRGSTPFRILLESGGDEPLRVSPRSALSRLHLPSACQAR